MPQLPQTINQHSLKSLTTSLRELLDAATYDVQSQPRSHVRFECHCQNLAEAAEAYLKADGQHQHRALEAPLRAIAATVRDDIFQHDSGRRRLDPSLDALQNAARFLCEEIPAPARAMARA